MRRTNRGIPWPLLFLIWLLFASGHIIGILFAIAVTAVFCGMLVERMAPGTMGTIYRNLAHGFSVAMFGTEGYYRPRSDRQQIRRNAAEAQRRAGYDPDSPQVIIDDIGLLAYEGDAQPKIYRAMDIPTTASHIRPFIVLDLSRVLPELSDEKHTVRFNLFDDSGNLRFTARARFTSQDHFITPKTYMPLDDQHPDGRWSLHVMAGDQPLAIHEFGWLQMGGAVRAQYTGDGEISMEKRRSRLEGEEVPVSLDELLADQDQRSAVEMRGQS